MMGMKIISKPIVGVLAAILIVCFFLPVAAEEVRPKHEADYTRAFCRNGTIEYSVRYATSNVFIDCLTAEHAIEVDWSDKWPEAIGQSLNYGMLMRKVPGVILVCRRSAASCRTYILRMKVAVRYYRLPIDVWYCEKSATKLSHCVFDERG